MKVDDMIFKSQKFKEHVLMVPVFFTLSILITMCICTLFFNYKYSLHKDSPTAEDVYGKTINSIVEIKAWTDDIGESLGTAEFIDYEGTLVTNAHVVTYKNLGITYEFQNYAIRFATDENFISVDIIKYDIDQDIAILKMYLDTK